jgi:inosose dehydratase
MPLVNDLSRQFADQYGVVTGGTQGMGEAVARLLAGRGAAGIVICGRNAERGVAVARDLGSKGCDVRFVAADLAKVEDCRVVIGAADKAWGKLHVLVNCAGVTDRGTILDTSPELFDRIFAVNVRAPFLLMQDALKVMLKNRIEGSIVNIISMSSHGGQPFISAYCASKGALATLTRNVAFSALRDRIRVNGLNIGWSDTPGEDRIMKTYHEAKPGWIDKAEQSLPFGRLIKPEEVARAVAYLASAESGLITGSIIDFDQAIRGSYETATPSHRAPWRSNCRHDPRRRRTPPARPLTTRKRRNHGMTIRIGTNPIAWSNDDMPELGGDTPLETCLREAAEAGFVGIEKGNKFPTDPKALKDVLGKFGLSFVSGWYSARLRERTPLAEVEAMKPHLDLLVAMGCKVMVFAETSGSTQGDRARPFADRPRMSEAEWRDYPGKITEVARHMKRHGVHLAFHHHMGTVIETKAEIDRLMEATPSEVGLLYDTGHLVFAGEDPEAVARQWAHRIVHVHAKDVRADVLKKAREGKWSFLDSVVAGIYTVPGDGSIDFRRALKPLADIGYDGWLIVEAEQDPTKAYPLTYARKGYRHLREIALQLSLKIAA